MASVKMMLNFPPSVVKKPVVYKIVKDFDLEFNILRAEITSDLEGKMLLEIKGSRSKIEECRKYLQGEGVEVKEARGILFETNLCVDCGLCASLCITGALYIKEGSMKIGFDKDKCILCGLCLNACPVNAIKSMI